MENTGTTEFINRRREHRIPYFEKIIFSDGKNHLTAHPINISRGGLFITTLDSMPLETMGYLVFMLSSHSRSISIKARVAHIVYDKQRCEVECGMGLQFLDITRTQLNLLTLHILNDQNNYLELREALKDEKPNFITVSRIKSKLPGLDRYDLLGLRYRVNRICTLFDNPPLAETIPIPLSQVG